MSAELYDKLLQIQKEKNTKIKPENIKKNVQVFDVVGTLDTPTNIYGTKNYRQLQIPIPNIISSSNNIKCCKFNNKFILYTDNYFFIYKYENNNYTILKQSVEKASYNDKFGTVIGLTDTKLYYYCSYYNSPTYIGAWKSYDLETDTSTTLTSQTYFSLGVSLIIDNCIGINGAGFGYYIDTTTDNMIISNCTQSQYYYKTNGTGNPLNFYYGSDTFSRTDIYKFNNTTFRLEQLNSLSNKVVDLVSWDNSRIFIDGNCYSCDSACNPIQLLASNVYERPPLTSSRGDLWCLNDTYYLLYNKLCIFNTTTNNFVVEDTLNSNYSVNQGAFIYYRSNNSNYLNYLDFYEDTNAVIGFNYDNKNYYTTAQSFDSDSVLSGVSVINSLGESTTGTMTNNGTLNYTPTTTNQTIPTGYVNGGTVQGDPDLISSNIKSGVSIFGVSGSVTELNGSSTAITPTTTQQTITPIAPSNGFTSIRVDPVTSSIDVNIVPENIKKDISILGVTGTLETLDKIYATRGYRTFTIDVSDIVTTYIPYIYLYENTLIVGNNSYANIYKIDSLGTIQLDNTITFPTGNNYKCNYILGIKGNTLLYVNLTSDTYNSYTRIYSYDLNTLTTNLLFNNSYSNYNAFQLINNEEFSIKASGVALLYCPMTYNYDTNTLTYPSSYKSFADSSYVALKGVGNPYVYYYNGNNTELYKYDKINNVVNRVNTLQNITVSCVNYFNNKIFIGGNVYACDSACNVGNLLKENVYNTSYNLKCLNDTYYKVGDDLCEFNETTNTFTTTASLSNWSIFGDSTFYKFNNNTKELQIIDFTPSDNVEIGFRYNNNSYYTVAEDYNSSSVLSNTQVVDSFGNLVTGTMPNNGAVAYTPTTSQQNIANGYHNGSTIAAVTSAIDNNIKQNNIVEGITILGVTGTWNGNYINITDTATQMTNAPYGYIAGASGSITQAKTYYDTGIIADQDTEIIIKYAGMGKSYNIDGTLSTELCQLFGFRYRNGGTSSRQFGFSDYNGGCFSFGSQEVDISGTSYTLCENDYTTIKTLKLNKNGIYLYNTITGEYDLIKALTFDGNDFTTESTLTLLGRNTYYTSTNRYSLDGRGYMRIYSMQVYENGVLTNDFQPKVLTFIPPTFIYRPIGFYDTITNKFLLPKTYTPYDLQ